MGLYAWVRPLLFRLDAERAHNGVTDALAALNRVPVAVRLLRAACAYRHPALEQTVWGLCFPNPVGLAAGFDKDARLVAPMVALGFGFLEVGTVTPRAQVGNPRPRLFRLPADRALINRMGFNNEGAAAAARRLAAGGAPPVPVGVNLGKNRETPLDRAAEDYVAALQAVIQVAAYLTVNISSPNTPGLRDLQAQDSLRDLLSPILAARDGYLTGSGPRVPVLLKLSPDVAPEDLPGILDVALEAGVDGVIATNTTLSREGLSDPCRGETGGLSGEPLYPMALDRVRAISRHLRGRIPVVGVGGISNSREAYAMIRAGASLVQVYSALIYQGPYVVRDINHGLVALLERDGLHSLAAAVGADIDGFPTHSGTGSRDNSSGMP